MYSQDQLMIHHCITATLQLYDHLLHRTTTLTNSITHFCKHIITAYSSLDAHWTQRNGCPLPWRARNQVSSEHLLSHVGSVWWTRQAMTTTGDLCYKQQIIKTNEMKVAVRHRRRVLRLQCQCQDTGLEYSDCSASVKQRRATVKLTWWGCMLASTDFINRLDRRGRRHSLDWGMTWTAISGSKPTNERIHRLTVCWDDWWSLS